MYSVKCRWCARIFMFVASISPFFINTIIIPSNYMIACKRITWKKCGSIMSNMLHVKTKWKFFYFFTTGKHTALAYKLDSYVLKIRVGCVVLSLHLHFVKFRFCVSNQNVIKKSNAVAKVATTATIFSSPYYTLFAQSAVTCYTHTFYRNGLVSSHRISCVYILYFRFVYEILYI